MQRSPKPSAQRRGREGVVADEEDVLDALGGGALRQELADRLVLLRAALALRLRGVNLAVVTLAAAFAIVIGVGNVSMPVLIVTGVVTN